MNQSHRKRILIADNDEELLIALERILETKGYHTALAISYQQLTERIAQETFDLMVLDDYLGDVECAQVLAECQRAGSRSPAIVTFHHEPSPALRHNAMALGAITFVSKQAHDEVAGWVDWSFARRPPDFRFESMT